MSEIALAFSLAALIISAVMAVDYIRYKRKLGKAFDELTWRDEWVNKQSRIRSRGR